ncbi:MAG: class I SAM-dependent methyltransferase [Chloroflexota bacterium]|nr:class I SAM-dependent methyltransferase [Chloroflexota bacterium]
MQQYDAYAAAYDRSGQLRFSILMDVYLRDLLRSHAVPGWTMVDLACGTGTLALLMAERGWTVLGLDNSPAMLAQAEQKRATLNKPVAVQFGQADMRDFALATPVDLVTCCFDTLNYLTAEAELACCLAAVARALVPQGLFCFDLATDYFLRHYWQGVEFEEFDGYSQVMHSHYDAATGCSTLVLTGFTATASGSYQRFREVHVERAYPDVVVRQLLAQAGLVVEAVYDCFTLQPPNERSLRLMYVARRRPPDE